MGKENGSFQKYDMISFDDWERGKVRTWLFAYSLE